jgi:LacI family transcriptional regulator
MQKSNSTKVTIKDIARMCNVSTQTISRVLNNRPDVSPETRELVEKTILEHGYKPSAVARSLVQQRSYMLGVITAGIKFVGVANTMNGITEESEASNFALIVKELPSFKTPDIVPVIESLISHQVEGIIFAVPDINDNIARVQAVLPSFCPPIVFLKGGSNPKFTTISIDNYSGARKAVQYLIDQGFTKIAHISGPLDWLEARQRKSGWEDVMREAGLLVDDHCWIEGNWSSSSGETAFQELYAKYPDMEAIFVGNDQMSLGLLHYTNAQGIHIPETLSIVGFDDLAESAFYSPALTTIHHPLRDLGVLAVKSLVELIDSKSDTVEHKNILLEPSLVVRESSRKK